MYINPKYTWSDRLQAGVKLWFLLLTIGVSFFAIFMSVNIDEGSTFQKELLTLLNVFFTFNLSLCNFNNLLELILYSLRRQN